MLSTSDKMLHSVRIGGAKISDSPSQVLWRSSLKNSLPSSQPSEAVVDQWEWIARSTGTRQKADLQTGSYYRWKQRGRGKDGLSGV